MYKVVIIDDEPIIVEGLKKTVNCGYYFYRYSDAAAGRAYHDRSN